MNTYLHNNEKQFSILSTDAQNYLYSIAKIGPM